jgi:hypothetical protein
MTIEDIKQRIRDEISAISEEMTQQVMRNLRVRLEECLRNSGRHVSDVVSKKNKMVCNVVSSNNNHKREK